MSEQTNQQTDFANQWITKQAAIEALFDWEMTYDWDEHCREEDPKPAYIVSPSDVIEQLPSAQPESCEGCKWENAFGYGECGRCRRRLEDMYERGTCENE